MRRIANIITAYIYIFFVKQVTKQSKIEILNGKEISKFGANLVFSSFVLMIMIMASFYILIWGFQFIISLYQQQ